MGPSFMEAVKSEAQNGRPTVYGEGGPYIDSTILRDPLHY